ncbi:MAG: class I tRNA ligase family protein [Patescibacteria group bacterium]
MDEPTKDEQECEIQKEKEALLDTTENATDKREEETLAFWRKNRIFEKTLEKPAPHGEFVFYDGPPFATGLPHYGHILAGTIKDAIPRYKTMQGYRVRRRWGWDCHGLPLENQIEAELGIKTKRDIETLGVAKFNAAARKAVLRYADDWKRIVPRFGRFVDMEDDYRTMDASYTESVWWAFKNLYDKGLIYEGFKSMHLCPRCGTTLSNFEVAQGYKDITDIAVTVKLPLADDPKTFLLVWTTTPWTLPGNMAAAVHPDSMYVQVKAGDENYILGKERVAHVVKGEHTVEREFLGRELVGKSYVPPFMYFAGHKMADKERAWKVYAAPYVTMEDGTGLVHLAPAFGAEDLALAEKERIPIVHHVNRDGFFVDSVADFKGMQAKPKDDPSNPSGPGPQSTDVAILKYLAARGLLYAKEKVTHSYPHCWRCETPLLNYAASSWFVAVTRFSKKLVSENDKVHWVPRDVGQNRFGDWLENARDWAISRARYWGAPIPVWRNPKTKAAVVVGSLDDLKRYARRSGNRYFVMRHGESEKNVKAVISAKSVDTFPLTVKGKRDAEVAARKLPGKIDVIATSPLLRARETAEIMRKTLGLPESSVIEDARFTEYDHGVFDLRPDAEFVSRYPSAALLMDVGPEKGESVTGMRRRVGDALYELERKHTRKNILIVTHGYPASALVAAARGAGREETVDLLDNREPEPAEVMSLPFTPLPHDENYELDFHRPYIDEVELIAPDGTRLERVQDVFDCWFESGSMPYAQDHYPFKNRTRFDPSPGLFRKSRGYPADFIAEGLDQTRGWFYSLIVLGTALFGRAPYKSVIVNGIVLAEDGQKMSKRLKNYPDPLDVVSRHGADALRYYLLASPLMRAEDLNFSEKSVAEIASKVVGRLVNVLSFYELYRDGAHSSGASPHALDRWILSRLAETIGEITDGMESYELDRAARPIAEFVDDFSTWYIRNSRDRFKDGGADAAHALQTTRTVLETFAKVIAPFMPFAAEHVFQRVKRGRGESVHLEAWPVSGVINLGAIAEMNEVREAVSIGLQARQSAGIKVRQPIAKVETNSKVVHLYSSIVIGALNTMRVEFSPRLGTTIRIDTAMTDELKAMGEMRELLREVQDLRKKAGLMPKEKAVLTIPPARRAHVAKHEAKLIAAANLARVEEGPAFHVKRA